MKKIKIKSFGFKYGQPQANYYFDVSFIKNPARQKEWGFFSDVDNKMIDFVMEQENAKKFIDKAIALIEVLADVDQNQVFAFGCNAGRHRSVIIAEHIKTCLENKNVEVSIEHRDLE